MQEPSNSQAKIDTASQAAKSVKKPIILELPFTEDRAEYEGLNGVAAVAELTAADRPPDTADPDVKGDVRSRRPADFDPFVLETQSLVEGPAVIKIDPGIEERGPLPDDVTEHAGLPELSSS